MGYKMYFEKFCIFLPVLCLCAGYYAIFQYPALFFSAFAFEFLVLGLGAIAEIADKRINKNKITAES